MNNTKEKSPISWSAYFAMELPFVVLNNMDYRVNV